MTIKHAVVIAGLFSVLAVPAMAGEPGKSAGKGWKKGQGWEMFAASFDTNKDGKVTKEEMLAKQPGFDRADADHDGFVSETEYDALPAGKNRPNLKSWIAKFDKDKDQKVSLAEWNEGRVAGFEKADKNKDGAIEKGEFTPELVNNTPSN